jgi:uncharacterized membrane protein
MPDRVARFFAGPVMVFAGCMHFVKPRWYERIMPPYLPAHRELVYLSGVAEAGSALMTMNPRTRRLGGLLQIVTLAAIFPANLHMALHADDFSEVPGGRASLWCRLPFQGLFIWWCYRATLRD